MTKTNERFNIVDYSWAGVKVDKPFKQAYDRLNKQRGVMYKDTFYPTVPLNGWRARDLAEKVLGKREAGLWELGKAMIVEASILQNLPGFDSQNQEIVDSFSGEVMIHVAVDDPSYGVHIRIVPA